MDINFAILGCLLVPTIAMFGNMVFRNSADLRDFFTLTCAGVTFACVLAILSEVGGGTSDAFSLFSLILFHVPVLRSPYYLCPVRFLQFRLSLFSELSTRRSSQAGRL